MTFNESNVFFDGDCDIVVMGTNPEMADVTNPRGEYHGFRPFVFATDDKGNRKAFYVGDAVAYHRFTGQEILEKVRARAVSMATYFNDRFRNGGKLPLRWAEWRDTRPAYGSEAYIAYGAADDIAWERSQEDY